MIARSEHLGSCPCGGHGPHARPDGARFDSAGPHFPCPSCGARASDSWFEEPELDDWELDLAPHPGFGFEPPAERL